MKNSLSAEQKHELLQLLHHRFEKNTHRHPDISWAEVEKRIANDEKVLATLFQMEETGGEPDVAKLSDDAKSLYFVDFSKETPKGRRSICYDQDALESRKMHKPAHSAQGMAEEMGVTILNEAQYFALQNLEALDEKTSSWLSTPPSVREKGGALFGDRRFGRVFIYHNGAESYYGVRGFRAFIKIDL